jgi:hypothetical protein
MPGATITPDEAMIVGHPISIKLAGFEFQGGRTWKHISTGFIDMNIFPFYARDLNFFLRCYSNTGVQEQETRK